MINSINLFIYQFTYLDKNNNILEIQVKKCWNKKDAVKIANSILNNLSDNKIVKIKTQKSFYIKKLF